MKGLRFAVALAAVSAVAGLAAVSASAEAVTNGGFESGDFTGWTTTTDEGGGGAWFVSNDGYSSCGDETATPDGSYAALWDMEGPSYGILTQDMTVPEDGVLSVSYAYDNWAGSWDQDTETGPYDLGTANEWLRIDVIKSTAATDTLDPADILATIFNSQSGSPSFSQEWATGTASLAAYAGQTVTFRVVSVNSEDCLPVWIDDVSLATSTQGGARVGYCSAPGNMNPETGKVYTAGTFLDLLYGQPSGDPNYANATVANFVAGKGITCDPPPAGYVLSGSSGTVEGTDGVYPYWAAPKK